MPLTKSSGDLRGILRLREEVDDVRERRAQVEPESRLLLVREHTQPYHRPPLLRTSASSRESVAPRGNDPKREWNDPKWERSEAGIGARTQQAFAASGARLAGPEISLVYGVTALISSVIASLSLQQTATRPCTSAAQGRCGPEWRGNSDE